MNLLRNNKFWIPFTFISVAIFIFFYNNKRKKIFAETGVYTIGKIINLEGASGGLKPDIQIYYNGNMHNIGAISSSWEIRKKDIGKRLFVKFPKDNIKLVYTYSIKYLVPDSIEVAPSEGWSQEWMEENFPDVARGLSW